MDVSGHRLRAADPADLPAVNAVVEAAIAGWRIPERVRRLALPSYRYDTADLAQMSLVVAESPDGRIDGVVAVEPAADGAALGRPLAIHGLYVRPECQRRGLGARLVDAAAAVARRLGCDGLVVRANREARAFFLHRGFAELPTADAERDYPHRFWRPLS